METKSSSIGMKEIRKAHLRPETMINPPSDEELKKLCEDADTCKRLREKFMLISAEIIPRIVFPLLDEQVEKRVARRLGIDENELKRIREALLKNGAEYTENEQVANLIAIVETQSSQETQRVLLEVINEQLKYFKSYILDRAQLELALEEKQYRDQKTGALNHKGIEKRFELEFKKLNAPKTEAPEDRREFQEKHMLLVEFDINKFKLINDDPRRGHSVGDRILKEVVDMLTKTLRPTDAVARKGGDEFSLIITDVNEQDIKKIKEKIKHTIELISDRDKSYISVTGSIKKIKQGDKISYEQASEEADLTASIAKIIYEGELIECPADIKISQTDGEKKVKLARAIVARKIKREMSMYEQQLENTEDALEKKNLKEIISLLQGRMNLDIQIELIKMKRREGVYATIIE